MDNEEQVIDLRDLWSALVKHKQFIAKCTAGCVLLAGLGIFALSKPVYESKATVQVKIPKSIDKPMYDHNMVPVNAMVLGRYQEILKSRAVMMPVVERFADKEAFAKNRDAAFEAFSKNITIANTKNTDTLAITVSAKTADEAKSINTMVLANFLLKATELERGNTSATVDFLRSQLREARLKMDEAQKNLVDFQNEIGVNNPSQQEKLAEDKYKRAKEMQINSELAIENANNRISVINGQLQSKGELLLDNAVIGEYKKQLKALQTKKVKLLVDFTEKHPDVIKVDQEMEVLRQRIEEEVAKVADASSEISTNPIYKELYKQKLELEMTVANNRMSLEMGKRLEAEYKEDLEKLSTNRVKYTDLTRELNTAKETYNMLTKRLEENRVASAADTGSVQIMDAPSLPSSPASQKRAMKLGIAFLLGLLGSSGFVIGRELLNPKVKKETDITEQLGVNLLASVAVGDMESFRGLRASLLALGVRKFVFGGTGAGEIATIVADLLRKAGFSTMLMDTAGLAKVVADYGAVAESEALASKAVSQVLDSYVASNDYVMIDSSAENCDALALGDKVDGVVEVVKAETQSPDELKARLAAYKQAGVKLLGVVLVK